MEESLPLIWLIAGVILVFLEFALPGFIVVFFGSSAILVGILAYLGVFTSLEMQLITFSALSVAQLLLIRRWLKGIFSGDRSDSEGDEYIGQRVQVLADFKNGHGRVSFRGAGWDANSDESLKEGEEAIITKRSGMNFQVKGAS